MILFGPYYNRKSKIDAGDLRDLIKSICDLESDMEGLGIPIKIEATVQISFPEPAKRGKK